MLTKVKLEGLVDGGLIRSNGIDLSLKRILVFSSSGYVKGSETILPEHEELKCSRNAYFIKPGIYIFETNESMTLDGKTTAIVQPRSSLVRCGVTCYSGIWDVGYCGPINILTHVINPHGFAIDKNARFAQVAFFEANPHIENEEDLYNGQWSQK